MTEDADRMVGAILHLIGVGNLTELNKRIDTLRKNSVKDIELRLPKMKLFGYDVVVSKDETVGVYEVEEVEYDEEIENRRGNDYYSKEFLEEYQKAKARI